jgi:hypothetical protein
MCSCLLPSKPTASYTVCCLPPLAVFPFSFQRHRRLPDGSAISLQPGNPFRLDGLCVLLLMPPVCCLCVWVLDDSALGEALSFGSRHFTPLRAALNCIILLTIPNQLSERSSMWIWECVSINGAVGHLRTTCGDVHAELLGLVQQRD